MILVKLFISSFHMLRCAVLFLPDSEPKRELVAGLQTEHGLSGQRLVPSTTLSLSPRAASKRRSINCETAAGTGLGTTRARIWKVVQEAARHGPRLERDC